MKDQSCRRDCTGKQKTTNGGVMLSHSIAVILNTQLYERQNRRSCLGLLDSFAILMLTQDLKKQSIRLREFKFSICPVSTFFFFF